jgi:hypothetical protein
MKQKASKQRAFRVVLIVGILGSWAATAWAAHGVYSHNFFTSESPKEAHPRTLETALVITEDMVDSEGEPLPVHFGFSYANGLGFEESKTKVIVKVKVYRGAKRLWQAKQMMLRDEALGYQHVLCKTYVKGLEAGDLVEFAYTFKKAPKPGKVDLIRLFAVAGPPEMWEDSLGLWPLSDSYRECEP